MWHGAERAAGERHDGEATVVGRGDQAGIAVTPERLSVPAVLAVAGAVREVRIDAEQAACSRIGLGISGRACRRQREVVTAAVALQAGELRLALLNVRRSAAESAVLVRLVVKEAVAYALCQLHASLSVPDQSACVVDDVDLYGQSG